MTGATEATLAELLAVARSTDRNIAALNRLYSSSGGGGGGGSSGGGGGSSGVLSSVLSIAASGVRAAFGLLTDLISGLAAGIGKLLGAVAGAATGMINFAAAAAKGQATLSSLFSSFSQMPFFIGELAGVFAGIVKYGETLLTTYRQMSDVGAGFSGDLIGMRLAAGRAGIDLGNFTRIVRDNADIFSSAGQNVQNGVNFFVNVQQQLMGPGSRLHKTFTSLGYTAEQAADMTTTYIRMQGGLHRTELMNANGVADGVARMATEIDLYARATGRSREDVEKKLRESSMDQAYQNQLDYIGKRRLDVELGINAVNDRLGKGASDMLKTLVMTGGEVAIMTDDSKKAQIRTGNTLEAAMRNVYQTLVNSGLKGAALQTAMETQFRDVANGSAAFAKDMGNTSGILYMAQNKYFSGQQEIERNQRFLAGKTNEQIRANQVALENNAKNGGRVAMSLANAEKMIRDFGNQIFAIAATIIEPVLPYLIRFGTYMISVTGDLAGKVGPKIEWFVKFFQDNILPKLRSIGSWFGEQYDKLSKSKNAGDFFTTLIGSVKEGFTNIWREMKPVWDKEIKPVLISIWQDLVDAVKPYFITLTEDIIDLLNAWAFKAIGASEKFGIEDPEKRQTYRNVTRSFREDFSELESKRRAYELYKSSTKPEDQQLARDARATMEMLVRKLTDDFLDPRMKQKYGSFMRENEDKLRQMQRYQYDVGTLGRHGKLFNDFGSGTPAMLHGTEAVVTPEQMNGIINNNLSQGIQQLNSLTAQLLTAMRENNEISRRTLSATKSISGDLFA